MPTCWLLTTYWFKVWSNFRHIRWPWLVQFEPGWWMDSPIWKDLHMRRWCKQLSWSWLFWFDEINLSNLKHWWSWKCFTNSFQPRSQQSICRLLLPLCTSDISQLGQPIFSRKYPILSSSRQILLCWCLWHSRHLLVRTKPRHDIHFRCTCTLWHLCMGLRRCCWA